VVAFLETSCGFPALECAEDGIKGRPWPLQEEPGPDPACDLMLPKGGRPRLPNGYAGMNASAGVRS